MTDKQPQSRTTDKKPLKQAKQESPTGGGTRIGGHDRAGAAKSGSNPEKSQASTKK